MCQPSKWWWGLFPLAFLWLVSHELMAPTVEAELGAQATAALKASGPAGSWAKAKFDGRDAIIEGVAPTAALKQQAMDNIGTLDGVRLVDDMTSVMTVAKPFTWSATRAGSNVTLAGFVSPGDQRAKLVADAKKLMPTATIIDQMKDGGGANAAMAAMTAFGLGQLAKLKDGSVNLSDATYSIKGNAVDAAAYTALVAENKNLPKPMTMADMGLIAPVAMARAATPVVPAAKPASATAVVPPAPVAVAAPAAPTPAPAPVVPVVVPLPVVSPYLWSAQKSADGIMLTGSVPSDSARSLLLSSLKVSAPTAKINDQLKLGTGLPATVDYAVATGFIVNLMTNLKTGNAKLSDGALTLAGEANDAAAYQAAIKTLGAALPGGLKIDTASILPPRVADYVWEARQDSGTVALTGFYPDDATKQAIRSAVSLKFSGARVDDKMVIASGAPADLRAAALLGLEQLAKLESGTVSIDSKKLLVTGMASSEAIANDTKTALAKGVGTIPGDAKVAFRPAPPVPVPAPVAATTPTPLTAAPVTPAPAPVVATPAPVVAVPVAPAPVAPAPKAVAEAPAAPVTPAPAAPAPKVVAAVPTAPVPPVAAAAPAPKIVAAAPAAPKATVPAPASSAPAVVASNDMCEQDLGTAMKASRILFESSSAALRPSAQPVLLQIAAAIKRCGERKIEISGHTDNTGTPGFNESLSKNRAKAVADALAKTGIPMSRMQVAGYGPARPVAPNDTAANKLQNRRIEFSVIR